MLNMISLTGFIFLTVQIMKGLSENTEDLPICYSYKSLCDASFDLSSTGPQETSGLTCRCPGRVSCKTAKSDPQRTITLANTLESGETMTATLTYCNVHTYSKRKCKDYEPVVKLREFGPFDFRVVGGLTCICKKALVLRKSVPVWSASLGTYTCGTPICEINRPDQSFCGILVRRKSGLESKFPCQCPAKYHCFIEETRVPPYVGASVGFYCQEKPSNFRGFY